MLLRSRRECKYMIPPEQVSALRDWMRMFAEPDRYTRESPGGRYPIGSLYFDTADLRIYRMTATGMKNRFKLRIRAYSDHPDTPVFFEIKRRVDQTIRKTRVKMTRQDACDVLYGGVGSFGRPHTESTRGVDTFLALSDALCAGPMVRIRYEREAYESTGNDPVRLTLDHSLACSETRDLDFSLHSGTWLDVPMSGVLLEVKFTENYPNWVAEMIRYFGLRRISFSKYNHGIERMRQSVGDRSGYLLVEV